MSPLRVTFKKAGEPQTYALLKSQDNFGIEELDLLRAPGRFWAPSEPAPSNAELGVDTRRVQALPLPTELLIAGPGDNWMAMTRRSLARLAAWFLVVEDPQRRLEAQPIVTLAHQASVVQHIREQPSLRRVLVADEVGLGKTIEAALLIKAVVAENPNARVLYLAPARLVSNVRRELDKLNLRFRSWVATGDHDARLSDSRVVASIHRAAHKGRIDEVLAAPPWDMIIADECHHLSDWAPSGGKPLAQYKLVQKLAERLGESGRLLLMSGTPHQGNPDRFRNLLRLLQTKGEPEAKLAGRVIFRTKEDVQDWDGQPLFPGRKVNDPLVLDLSPEHRQWLEDIHELFEPGNATNKTAQHRAAGWRAGQALQWATSSVQAGLGYLVRQAIRAGCKLDSRPGLREALAAMRPYRRGPEDEAIDKLFVRIAAEVNRQIEEADVEDIEDIEDTEDDGQWRPNLQLLSRLLSDGVRIHRASGNAKWEFVFDHVLEPTGNEKIVLFAQPIETVTAVAAWLEFKTGQRPAMVLGGQSEKERSEQIQRFWEIDGPRFLVSSRAGGEGLNLQIAHRLVHLDVPWNPMELEQRVGRVHRFLSKRTIVVDTIVVKDSREVDTYAYARAKLKTIVMALAPDKFEALFARVMSLVPPEELSDILVQGPVGPLSNEERAKVADLVTRGFDQWKTFHDQYSGQQKLIHALDPGQASWADLATFAKNYLNATLADGFSALRFVWQNGEVVEASKAAEVLSINGRYWASGDYGGMPVLGDDGRKAEQLGTNVELVTQAVRGQALPDLPVGAAHVRWPEDVPRPHEGPFGVIIVARQSVRLEHASYAEQATTLHVCTVNAVGQRTPVDAQAKGVLVRSLVSATVRRDPAEAPNLVAALQRIEAELVNELRPPTEADRAAGVRHAVTPLIAAVVS